MTTENTEIKTTPKICKITVYVRWKPELTKAKVIHVKPAYTSAKYRVGRKIPFSCCWTAGQLSRKRDSALQHIATSSVLPARRRTCTRCHLLQESINKTQKFRRYTRLHRQQGTNSNELWLDSIWVFWKGSRAGRKDYFNAQSPEKVWWSAFEPGSAGLREETRRYKHGAQERAHYLSVIQEPNDCSSLSDLIGYLITS